MALTMSLIPCVTLLDDLSFFTIEYCNRFNETMVFLRAEMLVATEEILTDSGVRAQGSPDMLVIWNTQAAGK